MILNWFSPLPPAKTNIAHYTAQILPALRQRAEIILWTDQPEWDPILENYAAVRYYQPDQLSWADLNRGDMSVFHIGNDRLFHAAIWQVSRRHPGLVVLHDRCLHNFFAGLYRDQWNDHDGYVLQMERHYGERGRQAAEAFWSGKLTIKYMVEHYPLTLLMVEKALGVLVHSEEGLEDLRQRVPCPIAYAPLPYPASPRFDQRGPTAARARAAGPPYRIIVFGYIHVNRRLEALLRAIAGLPERDQFRLDIYGQVWDSDHVCTQIEAVGLQGIATLHGFVPEAELKHALEAAHLAVNLRCPTMGEASGSQLRIWDHALPSLVTPRGWYRYIPEDVAAFVRPESEVMDIQAHLRAFLSDPDHFAKMGERGRRILEERHTPEAYAQSIVDFIAEAQRYRPYSAVVELAERVSAKMQVWAGQPVPYLAPRFWDNGGGFSPEKGAIQMPVKAVNPAQVAVLQAVREAFAGQVERLDREQTTTVEAIRQVVTDHVEQLNHWHETVFERAPKEPYDREHSLRFPLSVSNHDTAFRYLFDFMVVAKSMNLRPGAKVLDFASGSGYVSELLNRLGYSTVAFDLDPGLLAIGRERLTLDSRCDAARTSFVVGDGLNLPFPDESFDGIICMNALHHMPDYHAALAEMYRVLRAGGRAVFSEPGAEHSKTPESVNMMREYGVLERDVILSEIYRLAKSVGFRRMVLKPFVSPEHVELDYEEFPLFKKGGKVSSAYLTPQEIATFIEQFHPLFYLERGGERPLTSATAGPELLQARIVIKECPSRVGRGERMKVVALCENTGQSLWLAQPRPFGGHVTFGVKVLTPAGRLLDDSKGRQLLSEDVPPGGRIEVISEVSLEGFKPGRYRVLFDMVNELVHWFQDKGSEAAERWVEIM
jgi:SAM-dependent methyltransferase/glycosyltransferase involved in cell wall biosynthesis